MVNRRLRMIFDERREGGREETKRAGRWELQRRGILNTR